MECKHKWIYPIFEASYNDFYYRECERCGFKDYLRKDNEKDWGL